MGECFFRFGFIGSKIKGYSKSGRFSFVRFRASFSRHASTLGVFPEVSTSGTLFPL
jgi:hypothetical protein